MLFLTRTLPHQGDQVERFDDEDDELDSETEETDFDIAEHASVRLLVGPG